MVNRRGIHPDALAAIAQPFFPAILLEIDWPGDEAVRVHSGLGDLVWGERIFRGVGGAGGISVPPEIGGMAMQPMRLTLGGIPAEIDDHLRAESQGRAVEIWNAVVTARAGDVLIGDPWSVFAGVVDAIDDEQTADTRFITVLVSSGPGQRALASAVHSYTDQLRFGGDTAGRWTNAAENRFSDVIVQW